MRFKDSRFHFVGVGGIGMCGLAELLHGSGAQVTGSDIAANQQTERLEEMGINVQYGHDAQHVHGADVVVFSSAIARDNVELVEARVKHIPIIPRAEALAELMHLKRGIAVAGSHGKTTTTSLVASLFLHAGLRPTIVVGGKLEHIKSTALLGQGEWFIAEADESDGSFAKLTPEIAIITNIDNDHLDYYKDFGRLQQAFYEFALKIPFYGQCIVCGDDPEVRQVFDQFPKKITYYGFNENNDYRIKKENGDYQVYDGENKLGQFRLELPGRHNALNALAAIIAGLAAGLDFVKCHDGVLSFTGVDRRFQLKGTANGIRVYDDYGHHPTEVRAVLSAFREKFPNNRLIVLFQPHRYSRTQLCWSQFIDAFAAADEVFVTDIYAAGEKPIDGISASLLASEISHKHCQYLPRTNIVELLTKELQAKDVFVTLGAGDGWKFGMDILKVLA